VIGIDASYTGTGICVIQGDDVLHRQLVCTEPTDGSDIERCLTIASHIGRAAIRFKAEGACIEGYAFGKMAGGEKLGELGGVVKSRLYTLGIPWATVPPQSLKQWVLGKAYRRDEGKRRMIAAARNFGCMTYDDNVADAFWCARWLLDHPEALTP
jgi:Holliday junction resolvasome RuvABC endonuclease subunit